MDDFVQCGIDYVNYDVASCRPLYDIYRGLTVATCDNVVASFNGIWTSLGISLFFLLPLMIVVRCLIVQFKKTELSPSGSWEEFNPYDRRNSFVRVSVNEYNEALPLQPKTTEGKTC